MLSRIKLPLTFSIPYLKKSMHSESKIRTAGMLIIGDEILNGKIKDTNSQYFADYCFELGIELRRISVVPDEQSEIIEVLNDLRSKYDFIVTTGGIGPTHDDITYESIANAFNLPLALDQPTVNRMNDLSPNPPNEKSKGSSELDAQLRMARFPSGQGVVPLFVSPDLWVPVVSLDSQIYIFPGIPSLYKQMLEGLRKHIEPRIDAPKLQRRYVSTITPESRLAPILSELHNRFASQGVKIGSYPHFHDKKNTVSILGPDSSVLSEIVNELIPKVEDGYELSREEEAKRS